MTGAQIETLRGIGTPSARLVFVDGAFVPGLSSVGALPAGVRAGSLAAALKAVPDLARPHLAHYAPDQVSPFAALNTAFLADGAFVHVPAGVTLDRPIELVFASSADGDPSVSHPRSLVVVDRGAQATVVESYVPLKDGLYWTNAVTEVVVGDGARCEYYRLQRDSREAYHVATTHTTQGRDSVLRLHPVTLGAGLARHDIYTALAGSGADLMLNGFYLLRGKQHADHHTVIDHAQPHCTSHEFFNGILGEQAHGVFTGRIIVRPGAQRTDSKQTNNNLLLSGDARADSQPQLEIYADDVKCTHGSTMGPLDETAMYYLQSRGLSPEMARGHADIRICRRDPRADGACRFAARTRSDDPDASGRPLPGRAAGVVLDTGRIRADFPLLRQLENGRRLVYLDNAATSQKPQAVLDAIAEYYRTTNANVHRGAYDLAVRATEAYEAARASVARFVNAWAPEGVVFTRGTTEAINLVASAYGRANVRRGDTVVVTAMDHHSNLVPWHILCEEKGATVTMVEITEDGRLDLADFGRALERRPKIVALPYVSNALGTVNPVAQLIRLAHAAGAVVVVDGAQSTPISGLMSRRSIAISTRCRVTRCWGRWDPARLSRSPRCSRRCRPIRVAAK